MSDAPPAEATPAPAPAAPEAAPAPAPAPAPAAPAAPAEPAPAPEAAPAADYPVVPDQPARDVAARTTWNGEKVEMTQGELDRLAHIGFSYLANQQGGQQPQQPAAEGGEGPDEITQVKTELAGLRQELNASNYESRVQGETRRINEQVDSEMPKHKVLADNPDLQAMARRSILATLSHNPRLSEEQATKQVANELGSALNKTRETWMKGKISDAGAAEAPPGGKSVATPRPTKLTGKDLMLGKVRDQAMARLGQKELINQ